MGARVRKSPGVIRAAVAGASRPASMASPTLALPAGPYAVNEEATVTLGAIVVGDVDAARDPAWQAEVTLTALNPDAWMATSVPYWEGPIRITGSHAGRGYLEMTGY